MQVSQTKKDLRTHWLDQIAAEEKAHKSFRDQATEAEKAYRKKTGGRFPIFWSTINVLHGAIFAKPPSPDVRRRNSGKGAASGDKLSQIIERCLVYCLDTENFPGNANLLGTDFLVTGCGITKVELVTKTEVQPVLNPIDQQPIAGDDGKPLTQKVITKQCVRHVHFPWKRFRWQPGKSWELCKWVSYDHLMTAEQIKEMFKVGELSSTDGKALDTNDPEKPESSKYAETYLVHEIWDDAKKERLFVSTCHEGPLEVSAFPLELESRFPSPCPAFTNQATDDLVPKPDYEFIKEQCDQIDEMTSRIRALIHSVRERGLYDASMPELSGMKEAGDGEYIPVKNLLDRLSSMTGRAGFEAVMAMEPNGPKVEVVQQLLQHREAEKAALFETIGIADILRGVSDPSETAAAQEMKGDWANVRLRPKLNEVNRYYRDLMRIMTEVICDKVSREQMAAMSGEEISEEEYAQLQNEAARTYVVDVETDSTIAADERAERQATMELLKVVTDYMNLLIPQVQQGVIPATLAKEMLLMAVRTYKNGRQLVDEINAMPDTLQQLQKLQQQLQQQQQQMQQMQMQMQEMQKQIGQFNAQEQGREDAVAQADIVGKQAEAAKDQSTMQLNQVKASKEAATPIIIGAGNSVST